MRKRRIRRCFVTSRRTALPTPLIVCFSRVGVTKFPENVDAVASASLRREDGVLVGNTQVAAKLLRKEVGGDLFQIGTVERYPTKYAATKDQAREELEAQARPALFPQLDSIAQYDTVYLCYPNWHGSLPMPVCTFLEAYDWTGKTIAPLCTHGGAATGNTEQELAALCPNATVLQAIAIRGQEADDSASQIRGWLNLLGLPRT